MTKPTAKAAAAKAQATRKAKAAPDTVTTTTERTTTTAPYAPPPRFKWETPKRRWFVLAAIVLVCAAFADDEPVRVETIAAPAARPTVITVPVPVTVANIRGDDNGDGRLDEDESGWNCETMGNRRCGDDERAPVVAAPTTTAPPSTTTTTTMAPPAEPVASAADADAPCLRTTFVDGSFVNLRKAGDGAFAIC